MEMEYVLLAFVLWEAKQLVVQFVGGRPSSAASLGVFACPKDQKCSHSALLPELAT